MATNRLKNGLKNYFPGLIRYQPFLEMGACFYEGPFTQAIFVVRLNAVFVAPGLRLQCRACKPAAISARFRRSFEPVRNLMQFCRDF